MADHDTGDLPVSACFPSFDHISLVPHLPNALNDPPGEPWASQTRSTAARLGSRMLVLGPDILMLFRGQVDANTEGQDAVFLWRAGTTDYHGWEQSAWTPVDMGAGRRDVLFEESDLRDSASGAQSGFDIASFGFGATYFVHQPDHFGPGQDRMLLYFKVKEREFTWKGKTETLTARSMPLGDWLFDGQQTVFEIGSPRTDRVCSIPEALEVRRKRNGPEPVDQRLEHRDLGDPRGVTEQSYLFGWDPVTQSTTVTFPHPEFSVKPLGGEKKHRLEIHRRRTAITCVAESLLRRDPASGGFAGIGVPRFLGPIRNHRKNSPDSPPTTESGADSLGAGAVWADDKDQLWMISPDGGGQFPNRAGTPPDPAKDGQGLAVRKALTADGTVFGPPVRVVDWTADPVAFAYGHRVQCASFAEGGHIYITSSGGNSRHPSGEWSNDYPSGAMIYRCSLGAGTDAQKKSAWSAPASGLLSFLRGPIDSPAGGGLWGPSIYRIGGTYYASSEHVGALPKKRTHDRTFDPEDYSNALTDWQLDLLRDDEYGGTRDRAVLARAKDLNGAALSVSALFSFDALRGTCLAKSSGQVPGKHDWWVEVHDDGRLVLTYVARKDRITIATGPGAVAVGGGPYQITVSLREKPADSGSASLRFYLNENLIGQSRDKAVAPVRNKDDIQFGSRNDKMQVVRGRMLYAAAYADWVTGQEAVSDRTSSNGASRKAMVRQYPVSEAKQQKQAVVNASGKKAPLRLSGQSYFNRKTHGIEFDGGFLSYNEEITSNSLSFRTDIPSLDAAWTDPGLSEGDYFLQNMETGRYLTCSAQAGAAPSCANKVPGQDGIWTVSRSSEFMTLSRGAFLLTSASRHNRQAPPVLAARTPGETQQFFLICKAEPDGGQSYVFVNRDTSRRLRSDQQQQGQVRLGYTNASDAAERWELILA